MIPDFPIKASVLNPETIPAALQLMQNGFKPVGGGTDLMVRRHAVKKSGIYPDNSLFSTRKIKGTDTYSVSGRRITIGSSLPLSEIIKIKELPQILKESLLSIASPGLRNTATLAGNICNASPAADSLPALYILDAVIHTAETVEGESAPAVRNIPVSEFVTGPGKTVLPETALVTAISFDYPSETDFFYRKIGTRAANALSKLSIAALWKIEDGRFTDFRLSIGACAATVIRSSDAENLIIGSALPVDDKIHLNALKIYEGLIKPIDDQRSTARYRRNTALRLIEDIFHNGGR